MLEALSPAFIDHPGFWYSTVVDKVPSVEASVKLS